MRAYLSLQRCSIFSFLNYTKKKIFVKSDKSGIIICMRALNKKELKQFFKKTSRHNREFSIILENIQYAKNVAGIFRTADAVCISNLFLTGISRTPPFGKNLRKASRNKERNVRWEYNNSSLNVIKRLKKENYYIIAVEITNDAVSLQEFPKLIHCNKKICFIFGNEVYGIVKKTLEVCDYSVYIPMYGKGKSLNVGVSVGIILYSTLTRSDIN